MSRADNIRKEILFQLYGCRPLVRQAAGIAREARKQGMDFTEREIKQELSFLADEGLLIRITEPGSTAELYRIHAQGVRTYEQNYAE